MTTISNSKETLQELEDIQKTLNGYLADSNYSDSHADIKDSLGEVSGYIGDVKNSITEQVRKASVQNYDIPNGKDPYERFAGGTLRNHYYSPTTHAPISNEAKALDFGGLLMVGSFEFLNPAFQSLNYLVQGGFLDLMIDYKEQRVEVYRYTVTVRNATTGSIISSKSGETSFGASTTVGTPSQEFSTAQISKMFGKKFNFTMNPIGIAVDIVSVMTGEEMSFEETIGAGIMRTVMDTFTGVVSQKIAGFVGVQSIYGAFAVQAVFGAVLGEFAEMAMGIDNHFGFGGELQYSTPTEDVFESAYTFDNVVESFKQALGMDFNKTVGLENEIGATIGTRNQFDSFGSEVTHDSFYDGTFSVSHTYDGLTSITNATTGYDGYSSFDSNGFNSSNVDGISVSQNAQGGYDVNDKKTGYSYSTNSVGKFSTNDPASSSSGGGGYGASSNSQHGSTTMGGSMGGNASPSGGRPGTGSMGGW